MNIQEAKMAVRNNVRVSPQFVSVAKQYVVGKINGSEPTKTNEVFQEFLKAQDATDCGVVVVNPNVDPSETIQRAARHLAYCLSFIEAIHALVGHGILVPLPQGNASWSGHIPYTTRYAGGSGESGAWNWGEMNMTFPQQVVAAPSLWATEGDHLLLERSIFVQDVVAGLADDAVNEALSDAVQCMRRDLHRPAVVMLGKAAEGAWIQLGETLSMAINGPGSAHDRFVEKSLRGRNATFARMIDSVMGLCENGRASEIFKRGGISLPEMEHAAAWSHVLRDARNAVHPAGKPAVPPIYDATYNLMLGARLHLPLMYQLREAAKTAPA
ncbi:MAG: hypothetical protein AAB289_07640 [Chloroflexota bacterium]